MRDFLANQPKDRKIKKLITRNEADDTCLLGYGLMPPLMAQARSTLTGYSASPRGTDTTPMNANRVMRTTMQRTHGLIGPNSVFIKRRYDCQRTLVIRIAATTSRWRFCDDYRAISLHIMCFCIALSFSAYLINIFCFAISWCNAHKERLRDIETDRQTDRDRERERDIYIYIEI